MSDEPSSPSCGPAGEGRLRHRHRLRTPLMRIFRPVFVLSTRQISPSTGDVGALLVQYFHGQPLASDVASARRSVLTLELHSNS